MASWRFSAYKGECPDDPLIGLIFEHQADVQSEEFEEQLEQIKLCLHQLGSNYDGWVGEDVVPFSGVLSINCWRCRFRPIAGVRKHCNLFLGFA